ncbi:MAG: PAS domain S-box protein [Asgard group archaeon]|nr:PAS domain S-box protein [Asgard group archaeon]
MLLRAVLLSTIESLKKQLEVKEKKLKKLEKQLQKYIKQNHDLTNSYNECEIRFKSLFEVNNEAIFFIDEKANYLNFNDFATELFGYTRKELMKRTAFELLSEYEEMDYLQKWDEIWKGSTFKPYERTFKKKNGETFLAEVRPSMVHDEGGNKIYMQSIVRDLSSREKIAQARDNERTAFRIIAESTLFGDDIISIASGILNGIATTLGFDAGAIRLFEKENNKLIPIATIGIKDLWKGAEKYILNLDDPDYIAAYVARTRKGSFSPDIHSTDLPEKYKKRLENLNINSHICWPLINSKKELLGVFNLGSYEKMDLQDDDRVHFVALTRMLTTAIEKVLTEKALSESEEKLRELNEELEDRVKDRTAKLKETINELEAFSYTVSHDLRTPLRGINGLCHALIEDYEHLLDEKGIDFLQRIRRASSKMSELIDDLLDYTIISQWNLVYTNVNMSIFTKTLMQDMLKQNPKYKVDLKIKNNMKVRGDSSLIRILLYNLLNNAMKFSMNKPKPIIEFGSKKKNGKVIFYISDNGIGFDMNFYEKLFKPFEILHTNSYKGNGIGLATVKRIIEKHNGEIWAESKVGKGSTFYFTF